jgi:hypothetical protein
LLDTQPAQFNAFFDESDAKQAGSCISKSRSNQTGSVAISIRLDHGQYIAVGTDGALDFLEIVPESGKVDFNPGRAGDRH